jgi:hypothetical protein
MCDEDIGERAGVMSNSRHARKRGILKSDSDGEQSMHMQAGESCLREED